MKHISYWFIHHTSAPYSYPNHSILSSVCAKERNQVQNLICFIRLLSYFVLKDWITLRACLEVIKSIWSCVTSSSALSYLLLSSQPVLRLLFLLFTHVLFHSFWDPECFVPVTVIGPGDPVVRKRDIPSYTSAYSLLWQPAANAPCDFWAIKTESAFLDVPHDRQDLPHDIQAESHCRPVFHVSRLWIWLLFVSPFLLHCLST